LDRRAFEQGALASCAVLGALAIWLLARLIWLLVPRGDVTLGAATPLLAGDRDALPPWFATAYVPGLTLREAVELHGHPLPVDALWLLLREAAAGLAAVHAQDTVHRDLKPSNVMLTLDGVTLIDFKDLPQLSPDQVYELWLITGDGRALPQAVFVPDAQGARVLLLTQELNGGRQLAVTVEHGPDGAAVRSQRPQISGSIT